MITRPIWCCSRLKHRSIAAGTLGVNNANVNRGRVNMLRMHEFAHVCIRPAFTNGGGLICKRCSKSCKVDESREMVTQDRGGGSRHRYESEMIDRKYY